MVPSINKYIILPIVYLIVDILWIYNTSQRLYAPMVEQVQSSPLKPRFEYAIGAYALLVLAILFVCMPLKTYYRTEHNMSIPMSIFWSYGLTGFLIYAIYNFTNATIFQTYPMHIVFLDSLWGFFVFYSIGVVDYIIE